MQLSSGFYKAFTNIKFIFKIHFSLLEAILITQIRMQIL